MGQLTLNVFNLNPCTVTLETELEFQDLTGQLTLNVYNLGPSTVTLETEPECQDLTGQLTLHTQQQTIKDPISHKVEDEV